MIVEDSAQNTEIPRNQEPELRPSYGEWAEDVESVAGGKEPKHFFEFLKRMAADKHARGQYKISSWKPEVIVARVFTQDETQIK